MRLRVALFIIAVLLIAYLLMYLTSLYSISELKQVVMRRAFNARSRKHSQDLVKQARLAVKYRKLKEYLKHNVLRNISSDVPIANDVMASEIVKEYPNMPIEYWIKNIRNNEINYFYNDTCAQFPYMYELIVKNLYWQPIEMSQKTTVQIYSAHYDSRSKDKKIVRIVSMVNRTIENFLGFHKTLYCQLWFDNDYEPALAPMDSTEYMWFDWWKSHGDGTFGPYLLGCSIPQSHINRIPVVASVVENACDSAKNMLRVINDQPQMKKEFAVCVKGLNFPQKDISLILTEWIEFLRLMGVDKIFFYQIEVHPNVKKVLDYYTSRGIADVRNVTLSPTSPYTPFIQHVFLNENEFIQMLNEIIHYNDCFYRNVNRYKYIILLDVDEVIFPMKDDNWHDLIRRAKNYTKENLSYNSFSARHIYFLDSFQKKDKYPGIPSYLHMMQNIYRSRIFTNPGDYVKTFFDTGNTIALHNHWPLVVKPNTFSAGFNEEDARLQHYRRTCHLTENCTKYLPNPVKDTSIWRFKDRLIPSIEYALTEMEFLD